MEALRPLLPPALSIDTYEGRAYVGVVPFTMRNVSPWWSPAVPGISHFHELNVRTYVHHEGRDPGVWFFSLDAAKLLAVLIARSGWHLPYFYADMELRTADRRVYYKSRRRWPTERPAEFEARYTIGEPLGASVPGSFEHFLAERYLLYADGGDGKLYTGQVHHHPYPLHRAEVHELRETMVLATGLPAPEGTPHALYSPGVDVDVYGLKALG
ncbi:uncharacterized protein CMC5_033870 [Chondromyces crocatus]|uniref:DUF2071 domain-containing protein n=2 Tax=Chondromyces crocatus TaxID=52 RepID=A0A0K1EEF9_CHOCO|nr:uncharacterized protein CMC5_033870 [Chondromyces crocatus]